MYLSRVEIRPQLRATRLALNSPQRLHAIVAASFPSSSAAGVSAGVSAGGFVGESVGGSTGVSAEASVGGSTGVSAEASVGGSRRHLWRLDKRGHSLYLLVVSPVEPDFTHLIEQLGWASSQQTWETKLYDPFLAHLRQGQEWQFRLRANPTHSVKRKDAPKERGMIRACSGIDGQKQWLEAQAHKHGFSLNGFELIDRSVHEFKRHGDDVTLHIATFEGLLRIDDPILLREALTGGIGRAKAYGCGLLTLARPYVGA